MEAFEYSPNEFWVVRLKDKVEPGNYTLNLDFKGSLVNFSLYSGDLRSDLVWQMLKAPPLISSGLHFSVL